MGLAFLPDGEHMLVTERPGRLRLVGLDGSRSEPLAGVPDVFARAQGGLLSMFGCRRRSSRTARSI